jgi:hypothetical protein
VSWRNDAQDSVKTPERFGAPARLSRFAHNQSHRPNERYKSGLSRIELFSIARRLEISSN